MGRTPHKLESGALWECALKILSGRAHSTGEIKEKLRRRAERLEDIDAILSKLKDYGYLNDRKYAENFATARQENQGFGKFRVLRELRTRRVAPKLAERAVEAAYRGKDEGQLVDEFLRRKYRNVKLDEFLAERKNLAAAYRRLRYAGFNSGVAIRALKKFSREAESLDALETPEEENREEPE
jgi:regulatory protein